MKLICRLHFFKTSPSRSLFALISQRKEETACGKVTFWGWRVARGILWQHWSLPIWFPVQKKKASDLTQPSVIDRGDAVNSKYCFWARGRIWLQTVWWSRINPWSNDMKWIRWLKSQDVLRDNVDQLNPCSSKNWPDKWTQVWSGVKMTRFSDLQSPLWSCHASIIKGCCLFFFIPTTAATSDYVAIALCNTWEISSAPVSPLKPVNVSSSPLSSAQDVI